MSRTFIRIFVIACFLGALPSQAHGLDFDKEIQKQNKIYNEITRSVGSTKSAQKPKVKSRGYKVSEFKVKLLPAKR